MNNDLETAEVLDEGLVEEVVETSTKKVDRRRKRPVCEPIEEPTSRRRTGAREVLPIDDELQQYFPCPVDSCLAVYQSRSERCFHLRQDHPGYKYREGDGVDKRRLSHPVVSDNEDENHILDVGTSEIIMNNGKPSIMSEDNISDYSEDQPDEDQYLHQIVDPKTWNNDMGIPQQNRGYQLEPRSIPEGIAGGNFTKDDEIFRNAVQNVRRRGRPKNPPGSEPAENSKVRVPDPTGRYRCYVPECPWRGGYRSIRAEHMKWVHKGWTAPPRYVLQRMSRDGVMYKEPEGTFGCLIPGCLWRGNYRASRSSHMKTQHPEYQSDKKKAQKGGYVADGKYLCHDNQCDWRGASRSTRAAHMKREHPGYLNPMFQPKMLLCADCNVQCCTHKTFCDHMVNEHKIGGTVQREFTDIQDYEEWYEAVQDAFSVEFSKKIGAKQSEGFQITYLYCAKGGGSRQKQMKSHPYSPVYMRDRNLTFPYRARHYCAAFLRVLHFTDGRLTVVGIVDHTGHRLGTSILRLSPSERDLMEIFIYINDDQTPLDGMLDKFREVEDYIVDGYFVNPCNADMLSNYVLDKFDERVSLNKLLELPNFGANNTFAVNIPELAAPEGETYVFTLGIMTEEMQDLWKLYGDKLVCLEEVRLIIGNWNLSLVFVLVFTEENYPRCCCLYMSNTGDSRLAVFKKLCEIMSKPPQTLITDGQDLSQCLLNVYGEAAYNIEVLIAEWHLLTEWAGNLDSYVQNRVDRFTIFACLRRWLRATDQALFDCYAVEMFQAFRELNIEQMSATLDVALSDAELFKKWSPMNRSGLTEHGNPVLDTACRNFRDRYLNAEICTRLDQYIGLLLTRMVEFNKCQTTEPIANGTIENMRTVPIYDVVAPERTILADGTVIDHGNNEGDMLEVEEGDLDDNTHQYVVDQKNGIIHKVMSDNIVQEYDFTEEVEEEEVVMDMEEIQSTSTGIPTHRSPLFKQGPMLELDQVILEDYDSHPSTSQMTHSSAVIVTESEQEKKHRITMLLDTIQKNPNSLKQHHLEILESSLSQVVGQFDHDPHLHDTV